MKSNENQGRTEGPAGQDHGAKTMAELDTDLKDKKSELFNLRFQLATGQL